MNKIPDELHGALLMSEAVATPNSQARIASTATFFGILVLAAAVRVIFFPGALGSDELVYLSQAHDLLSGTLAHSTYIGALRYGINVVQALSLLLFGNGVAGADGLFFACSLGEVGLIYYFANHVWGRPTAIWASLAMAFLPLDVALAGSLNPDCYIAFVIAASFVAFYIAEERDKPALYLASGLIAGWVFLIKEEVIVFGLTFVFIALAQRRWRKGYWWFVAGGLIWLLVSLVAFWAVYDNPLYIFDVLVAKVKIFDSSSNVDTTPWTYFTWLFARAYHVGLVGWLAAGGALLAIRSRHRGTQFVLIWGASLLFIFSFLPFSLHPLKFMPKQTNYMEIFLFPLVLLAGYFLSRQRFWVGVALGGAMILSGTVLSAMEQQVIRVVTADGIAAVEFARTHSNTPVFGPLIDRRQDMLQRLLHASSNDRPGILPEGDLAKKSFGPGPGETVVAYVIDDPQTKYWDPPYAKSNLPRGVRDCLMPANVLDPEGDFGFGRDIVSVLRRRMPLLPKFLTARIRRATNSLWRVAPVRIYAVTRACAERVRSG